MQTNDTAEILAKFAYKLKYEDIPGEVIKTTELFMADYYSAVMAGIMINKDFNKAIFDIVIGRGQKHEAGVIGSDIKLSVEDSAFMNAIYAHGADMDDGNRKAMGHVAAHVMSAVFALAEAERKKIKDVFTAVNVGYEVYNRVAAMAQPGLVHRGFHSTGTAGVIACAAASAKLLGLDMQGIYNAMGIAAIQASGLIIIAESGQANKPINPANAAKNGIISAKLAKAGIKGPKRPLESEKGWFHAMTDSVDYSFLEDLGRKYTIMESYLKPYPSCRHTHCGIDAAICIHEEMEKSGLKSEDIKEVELYIYNNAIKIAGQIETPESTEDAKFSIHYSLACSLIKGCFGLDDISVKFVYDAKEEPKKKASVYGLTENVINLIKKIKLIPDSSMENIQKGIRGSRLLVRFNNGKKLEKTVLLPKGDAENPLTWEDMRLKLSGSMYKNTEKIDEVLSGIRGLNENADNLWKGFLEISK